MANKPEQKQNLPSESGGTLTAVGWISRPKSSRSPVETELFFLTSLFIELIDLILSAVPDYSAKICVGCSDPSERYSSGAHVPTQYRRLCC